MNLTDILQRYKRRLAAPLVGYPGVKLTGTTALENLKDAHKQFETIKAIVEESGPDIVFPFMDLSVEAEALGLRVDFHENESPDVVNHPLKSPKELENFKVPDPQVDGRFGIFVDVIKKIKQNLPVMVGGYVTGPFTLAGLLMGAENLAVNTLMEPDFCYATLDFVTGVIIPYAKAQQQAGADFIVLLEPTAVLLSPKLFGDFVGVYVDRICNALKIPVVLHVCGNSTKLIPQMCETAVQGLSLDSAVDFREISEVVPGNVVLIGNIAPVEIILSKDAADVYNITLELLESMKDIPNFIPSTGCDVPPGASIENVTAFCRAVRDYGSGL